MLPESQQRPYESFSLLHDDRIQTLHRVVERNRSLQGSTIRFRVEGFFYYHVNYRQLHLNIYGRVRNKVLCLPELT